MSAIEWLQITNSVVALVALGVGGAWAFIKLRKRREHFPRVEFTVDVEFVGRHREAWLVSLNAFVENKGLVRWNMTSFSFDLRYLSRDDPLEEGGDEIDYQTLIPHLLKEGTWATDESLGEQWHGPGFVDPGLATRYSYVTTVPADAVFVLLHGYLDTRQGGRQYRHAADRLLQVPVEKA
jgi:hypothetical protein